MDAAWVLLIAVFVAFEMYALLNASPGDTLSGLTWRAVRRLTNGDRGRQLALALLILSIGVWLAYHFVYQPTMPH